jgi:hypothetical protein
MMDPYVRDRLVVMKRIKAKSTPHGEGLRPAQEALDANLATGE